jgi:hypothetical protein
VTHLLKEAFRGGHVIRRFHKARLAHRNLDSDIGIRLVAVFGGECSPNLKGSFSWSLFLTLNHGFSLSSIEALIADVVDYPRRRNVHQPLGCP